MSDINRTETGTQQPMQKPTQPQPRTQPTPQTANGTHMGDFEVHPHASAPEAHTQTRSAPATPRAAHSVPQTEQTAPRATTANTLHDVPSTSPNTLRVTSLYKSFGKKQAVRGVDFAMNTGEVLGLLGPNGAGKTTTFYMIVGFYRPTSGDVFCGETRITDKPMYKRARMGISYLPQDASVFRKLTVEQNIWAILEKRRDISRAEKKRKLDALIDEFSIGHIRKQPAYTLSGGERRRTEIARSLAIEPEFLLLDEPFAGIDPIAVADIKAMVRLLSRRGIGVLITDHNVRDTLEITDRAIIISSGEIVAQGSRDDILASPVARKIYLGEEFKM